MDNPRRSPETEDDAHRGPAGRAAKPRARWGLVLVVVVVIALVGLMVFLHLSGALGPGLH